jgi:hypothetical protein
MHRRGGAARSWAIAATALGIGLIGAAPAASAATRPGAATGGASAVGQQTARVHGTVDTNGAPTTYFFQVGTNRAYGINTAETSAGGGDRRVAVRADLSALAPATTYHYRLVAKNSAGVTRGGDRTFTTKRQPLGVVFNAVPNPVPLGGTTSLDGTLTGTGNGGRRVALQSNPYPFTQGFRNVGNELVTDVKGGFSFPILSLPLNTQYRVLMPERPGVVSPIVTVGVAVRVSTSVSTTRVRRGQRVRFSGTIRPVRDGTQVAFQKLRRGRWITIGGTIARHAGKTFSRYRRSVRIRRGGTFRVWVGSQGDFVSGAGRSVKIRTRRS